MTRSLCLILHNLVKSVFQQHILRILAQQGSTTTAPATTSGPTTVAGSPSAFDPFQYFPTMMAGWGAQNVAAIRQLSNILNNSLYILSNGSLDMTRLRGNNFVVDTSKYSDYILKGIINFTLQVYRQVFTNNTAVFRSPVPNKLDRVQNLKNALATFKIPDGGINALLTNRIGGNFKPIVLNILSIMK